MKKFLLFVALCSFSVAIFAQAKVTTHKVAKGESLYAIAKKYHVTVAAIEKANNITGETKLKLGQGLAIPVAGTAEAKPKAATTPEIKATDKPKVSATDKSSTVTQKAGSKIDKKPVATAKADAKADKKPTTAPATKPAQARAANDNPSSHTVAKGESLYSLARVYGVSVRHLREANNMSEETALKVGSKLNIPSKNPEADYKPATAEVVKQEEKPAAKAEATQPGREYLANDNEPVKLDKAEKKEPIPVTVKAEPSPVKVTEEKPTTPVVTDKPKEIVKEEKAPEPKETKEPKAPSAEPVKNTNVAPSDYVSVYNTYSTKGKKKVVYRGIGSFLKSENPGNQYLALYNYADMGAILKVTNLMSKQAIYVKVIGKVPASDAQNEIILKVSGEAASQLKVTEDKFLVEVTGYNE